MVLVVASIFCIFLESYTVIVSVSAKFDTCCSVLSVNWTLVEAKKCTFTLECTQFVFNKCRIYTHNGASDKFSTSLKRNELKCRVLPTKYIYIKSTTVYDTVCPLVGTDLEII
jgi:hypothetical protein